MLAALVLALPDKSKCSDFDLGMAEKMQLANKFSSSSFSDTELLLLVSEELRLDLSGWWWCGGRVLEDGVVAATSGDGSGAPDLNNIID